MKFYEVLPLAIDKGATIQRQSAPGVAYRYYDGVWQYKSVPDGAWNEIGFPVAGSDLCAIDWITFDEDCLG